MPHFFPMIVVLAYIAILFGFAAWAERDGQGRLKAGLRMPAYMLALAVFCTSWTFYGAVGTAATAGWTYLPIYLGPIFLYLFGSGFIRKLVDAVKSDGATSISDFIGGRFGKSRVVAALVTLIAVLGIIPYIALQLRSVGTSFAALTGVRTSFLPMAATAALLALFAMLFGTRRYEPSARNEAVLFAIAVESVVKIAALMVVGIFATLVYFNASPADQQVGLDHFRLNFAPSALSGDVIVIALVSMAAVICLPRQFYIGVIEAESSDDVSAARLPFVAYLLITTVLVVPITIAGLSLIGNATRPDLYVLNLPLQSGATWIGLIAFVGGFSAATAMVLVESIALSTMVSNDLIAPLLLRNTRLAERRDFGRLMLNIRRGTILAIMGAALAWAVGIHAQESLASIGLVAFAAMAQFAPALVMAVYRQRGDDKAIIAGLSAGLLLWLYTLAIPLIIPPDIASSLRGTLADPNALLGFSGFSPITHGVLWSIGGNMLAYGIVAARRVQPRAIPQLWRQSGSAGGAVSDMGSLGDFVSRFVTRHHFDDAIGDYDPAAPVDGQSARAAERLIAGVVGGPSARALMSSALSGATLSHEDVTRLLDESVQSLQFSKGLLAATLENIDPGVSVVDRDLNLVAWNSRYLDLFAYPPGLVRIGAPVAELIRYNALQGECGPGEVEDHVERRLNHMRSANHHSFERVRPDGRVLKTVGGPMPGGGYVMCFTDITAEAEARAAVERANAELETRVADRTAELSQANAALARADEDKTRFLAAASHDLLQPLHAARLFSAALGRDLDGRQKQILERVDRSIDSADALLRSLLDISKLDAGGIVPQPRLIALDDLLGDIVATMSPLAAEKNLSLRYVPTSAQVHSDPVLLRSIVQNFLSNAIRYTDHGGIVVGVRRRGREKRIDVVDSGPGIAPDKQEVIFREFERLDSGNDSGIGLGLAIVERTARLLGASIALRSRLGKGSRFSVTLQRPDMRDRSLTSVADAGLKPLSEQRALSILIVDDKPDNIEAMASYLKAGGHYSIAAHSSAEALGAAGPFDVALVDFDLGETGHNGLNLIAALRARQPSLRCALVTAERGPDVAVPAHAAGVDILAKPVSAQRLEQWLSAPPVATAAE